MDVELKYGFQPADFQPANLELARRMNVPIGAVRTSFLLDYLDLRGLL